MARMGANLILSLLLGVYLKVGAAGKASHGADWNYRVNDMNLLDVLRNSTRISPQCAAGETPRPTTSTHLHIPLAGCPVLCNHILRPRCDYADDAILRILSGHVIGT